MHDSQSQLQGAQPEPSSLGRVHMASLKIKIRTGVLFSQIAELCRAYQVGAYEGTYSHFGCERYAAV